MLLPFMKRDKIEKRAYDEMLPKYDFSKGARGKYASHFASGSNQKENVVFVKGNLYTRKNIHDALGGDMVSYLPTV
jgi:hypothetical protein